LGKVVYLPDINILTDFHEKENRIFEPLPSECFTKEPLISLSSKFDYYKSTKELYQSLATESSLSASFTSTFTLSTTVSAATKRKSSEKMESTLVEDFLDYLENLPLMVETPWFHNSWKEYRTFLNKYGSHVITSVKRGSRFQQMVFAESSESYSERDFQMKACISAAGPTPIGKLDISACSNGTSSKRSKASKMSISEKRFAREGLRATSGELANGETSAELIKKLIKEADEATSPIQYTFVPISSILQSRFKPGSKNYIRATNLDYYNGFLNYGCTYKKKSNLLNFKNSTKPEDQRRNVQNSNVQSQRKVAMATMIVTTCLVSGAIAEEKHFHERHVVWSLPATSKDVGKHKAPGNRTYNEASDPVTGQAEGMATPYTAEDAAKLMAKHPIQTQLKEEEI
ncbi:unnamed protein product, partial [Pocillopora meandrina]